MPTGNTTNVATLYNTSASTQAIMPQFYNPVPNNFQPTWTYTEPVMMAPPTPSRLSAREWLQNRIDEMCAIGHEALLAA